jgi:hypothetical protein
MDLIEAIKEQQRELLQAIDSEDWSARFAEADTPFSKAALAAWRSGGKKNEKK